ncbi:BppU family phage baseplate upper protein [Blautia stercoris]|uniref:BppU family phage baseplate upper protein n=1 Tax=Blautia stercoris TaxID=871664 RepID=UPI00355B3B0D
MATDVLITQKLAIELDGKSPFEYIVMKQGDKNSRILAITLVQNKQLYEIPDGCIARIKYYKPDGNPVLNDCTISDNEILVTYTEQMLAASGTGKGEIVLLKGEKELKSATYYTKIVETVYKTDGLVSDKEFLSMGTIFNDMDQAAQAAMANAKIAETAAANANQAANSANGAASAANSAAEKATSAAGTANSAAAAANQAAGVANTNTKLASDAVEKATSAAGTANSAAAAANQAANSANSAASAANSAAEKATSAAGTANSAAAAANQAAGNANSAVTKANEATTAANTAAQKATEQTMAAKAATEAAQTVADNVSGIIDEKILEAFFGSMRTGKVYQTEFYLTETNPTCTGTKTLANEGKVCEPSTDTVEGRDDYEGIGIFNWYNCNYITDDYGRKIPTAIEGWGNGYKNDSSVDVGVIAMTPYWNIEEKDGKQIWTLSDSSNEKYNLVGWEAARKEDGTFAPYVIHSKYVSALGADGLLRSFRNSKPARSQYYVNMITNYQKKGKGCWGAGKERSLYKILYQVIKYATKNEQTIFRGTTDYNFQYAASVQRSTKETYFPVTNEQAKNIIVGAYVSVGHGSISDSSVNNDRNFATTHKYADDVKVLKIEELDENNKAVYLDVTEGFTTEPVALSDTLNAQITMSSMHWWSGTTDKVIAKHDGSFESNTDGKHPCRLMGIEDAVGGYIVYADSVMVFKEDYSKDVYIARQGTKHVTDEATIKSTYKKIGNIPGNDGNDFWIGDIGVDTETCAWFAKIIGNSDKQGWGDRCYAGGKTVSGTREDLGRGTLWAGANGGPVCVNCGSRLGWAGWCFLGCD